VSQASLFDFPIVAPATAEQRALSIQGTLQGAYDVWRRTPEGIQVWLAVRGEALTEAHAGARRIGVKAIAERVRAELKVEVNNSLVALMARELVDTEPALAGLIELRRRHAA